MNWIAVKYFPLDQNLYELSEYLHAQDIRHRITEEQEQQCLWVRDEAVIPALQAFLVRYMQGSADLDAALVQPTGVPLKKAPSIAEQIIYTPIVVVLIALSCFGYSLFEGFFGYELLNELKFAPLYFSYHSGELWRILTPVFIHFSIVHLVFNCMCVWDLGRRLELFFGQFHFVLFFVVMAIIANLIQFSWSGATNFGGISGFICAMIGFIAVRQRFDSPPLIQIPPGYIGFMLLWLVLCMAGVIDYIFNVSIANAAHIGGLVAGALYALATKNFYRRQI